ncbi:MAG: sugar transferase [bacterium]
MSISSLTRRRIKIFRIRNQRLKMRLRQHLFPTRLFQIVFSIFWLTALSPLFLTIAILIKIVLPGPVFYRGARVGVGSTIFKVIKFRTLPERYESRVGGRLLSAKERYNGRLAAILIRFKLDELPQLINVLRGDMALVGPRPVRPIFFSKYGKEITGYAKRFQVKPGVTGLAQIVGGYYMDPKDKLRYDLLYIQHKCMALDIKIIILTIVTLFLGRNIMKHRFIEKFLNMSLKVNGSDISPSKEIYKKITNHDDPEHGLQNVNVNETKQRGH